MQLERLHLRRDDHVARVTLSGEPLGPREARELSAVAAELADDRSVRVVLVSSRGPDFCPGADPELVPLDAGVNPVRDLASSSAPVVAALPGRTASVGLEIALACDIRVAGSDASFALGDIAEGRLPCWGGTQRLPRAVGRPLALDMLLGGRELDGEEAAARGLVKETATEPDARAEELVSALSALGPLALSYAKEAVIEGSELPMRAGLRLEGDLNHLLQSSRDRAEGLEAFGEKRPPRFKGR